MSCDRRRWIQGLLGALSICSFWQRPAKGQQAGAGGSCSGTVSDPQGKGFHVVVEIVEPNGRVSAKDSDGQGVFGLPAPPSGPYVIQFREPQGNTRLHAIRQLTAGTNQMLSVTIDPQMSSFSALYDALQSVETLSALIIADRENSAAARLFPSIPFNQLTGALDQTMKFLEQIRPTDRQRQFLITKAEAVRKYVGMVG